MKKNKLYVLAAFLGAIGMNIGIGLATLMEVEVAPPIVMLPVTVTNTAWAMMAFFLVKNDIRFGYFLAIAVGASTILLPILVFFSILDPAPAIRPTHFVGIPSDITFGTMLIVTGLRGIQGKPESTVAALNI